jgi:hypothetical protein
MNLSFFLRNRRLFKVEGKFEEDSQKQKVINARFSLLRACIQEV